MLPNRIGGRSEALKRKRRGTFAAVLLLALVAVVITGPAQGEAETIGQIGEPWGSLGTTAGKFHQEWTGMFGVDPVDGSIFAGDINANFKQYRIQKFDPEGTLVGTAEIAAYADAPGTTQATSVHGVAIDHTQGRLYVLVGCHVNEGSTACQKATAPLWGAIKILAFKTEQEGSKLALASEIVLPAGANELYNPRAVAVDPANHEIELLGTNPTGQAVLQRVKPSGELGPRFGDTAGKLTPLIETPANGAQPAPATSIAIGSDGTTYAVTGAEHAPGAEWTRAWQLPQGLSKVEEVPHFPAAAEAESWTQGLLGKEYLPAPLIGGPQVAISLDGGTLYWKEESPLGGGEDVVIRGFSLTGASTSIVYGGGSGRCKLSSAGVGLGTVGDRLVAIDYEVGKVITFGPGGDGCPTPSARFTVNGSEEEGVEIEAETPVVFDASGSKQEGEEPRELLWNFGDGKTETVQCDWTGTGCGGEAKVTATHRYTSSGTFTVSLQYKLENPVFGNPPIVEHTVEVLGGSSTLFKLAVTKAGTGDGTVISERGINCGSDCESEYREGKEVALSAFPRSGSTFVGWSGACIGSGSCKVPMTGPKSVTATFEAIAPSSEGGGEDIPASSAAPAATPSTGSASKQKSTSKKQLRRCRTLKSKHRRGRCVKKANSKSGKHGKASGSSS